MKRIKFASALVFALLLAGVPCSRSLAPLVSPIYAQAEKKEVKVWVNTKTGVYHCPDSKWYGTTKQGQYMGECEAQKEGYRPAYGRACGSDCANKANQPMPQQKVEPSPPKGATALCADGTYSFSQHRRGTCSHHGGVKKWLTP
jgi:uncharacterized protein DUF3761